MEAVNSVCDDALDEHVWVPEQTISLEEAKVLEALQYDREIPCQVQWEMLWFSTSTSLDNELLNDEEIFGKYCEASQLGVPECFLCSIFCGKHTKDLFPENSQESFGRYA